MEPKITPGQTSYPGDEAFAKFLVKNKCPESFHVVIFRLWGHMTSVAMRVSPVSAINHLWGNELPEFENDDEAQSFFDTMFSLWNALSEMNMAGRRLKLSQRHGLDNADGHCQRKILNTRGGHGTPCLNPENLGKSMAAKYEVTVLAKYSTFL